MYYFECDVSIRFTRQEVNAWLVDNKEIAEDKAEGYMPTDEQLNRFAWYCLDIEDCEYKYMRRK